MKLDGKTLVITGAGRGIGRSLALYFAGKGASLALLDLDESEVNATAALCAREGVAARCYVGNIADESSVVSTLDAIVRDCGNIHGLINNAGIVRDSMLLKVDNGRVARKMSLAQWQAVIDVNLTGVFLCTREAAQRMIELGTGGVIVKISSISRSGNVGQTNYSAAKAGVVAMTVVWARELARYGIRVGAVAPGFIRTSMVEGMKPEVVAKVVGSVPLGRLGEPEEIAHAAGFIFMNDFFTGRVLDLDGGLRL